ncbi:MAG: SoxR reducing system RseC family protein [Deltaproteobacteria bacterium]|nr:SoxR reducing system RseC family protein [Deltaproteobacteria bacterium]
MSGRRLEDGNIIKSVFLAYFIIGFHIVFLGCIGVMFLFFNTLAHYFMWILLLSALTLTGSGFFLLRYMHKQRLFLLKLLSLPEFKGRSLEINLLGGLASVKISGENIPSDSGLVRDIETDNVVEISECRTLPKKIFMADRTNYIAGEYPVTTKKEQSL